MAKRKLRAVSLFTGAGGLDIGFANAGVKIVWANEWDKDAAATFEANHPGVMHRGDIRDLMDDLDSLKGVDLVFGGPPCQGFSVAGKMNPEDERSTLLWSLLGAVDRVQPKAFVCENVKALGKLTKWGPVRRDFILEAKRLGYSCSFIILNSADFGVPQKRERVFFIGVRNAVVTQEELSYRFESYHQPQVTVRKAIGHLGPAGSQGNPNTCNARITMASNPVMRKSPFAGMMFNGAGRPLNLDGCSSTLPASMGGNKTPIIDEDLLYGDAEENWIIGYHAGLWAGGEPIPFEETPSRLRRLTLDEAALLQSFPEDYVFCGSKSSIWKQIGNAVPSLLGEAVAKVTMDIVSGKPAPEPEPKPGRPVQKALALP